MALSKLMNSILHRLATARTDLEWQHALIEARKKRIEEEELRRRLPRFEERMGIPPEERNSRLRMIGVEVGMTRLSNQRNAVLETKRVANRTQRRTRASNGRSSSATARADDDEDDDSAAEASVSRDAVDDRGASSLEDNSVDKGHSEDEEDVDMDEVTSLTSEQWAVVDGWRRELVLMEKEADWLVEVARRTPVCVNAGDDDDGGGDSYQVLSDEGMEQNGEPGSIATEKGHRNGKVVTHASTTAHADSIFDARSFLAKAIQSELNDQDRNRWNEKALFARSMHMIEDLERVERRRERLLDRVENNYRLQLGYIKRYSESFKMQANDEMKASVQDLRDMMVGAAQLTDRRERVTEQMQRDPMVLFGEPPCMIPPGYAGVPYQLVSAPKPSQPFAVDAVGQPNMAGLTLPREWDTSDCISFERRPVHVCALVSDTEEDVRHIQKNMSAIRRRARLSAQQAAERAANESRGRGGWSGRGGTSKRGTQTGALARGTSGRSRGRGRAARSATRDISAADAESNGTLYWENNGVEHESALQVDEMRARAAVGLIHKVNAILTDERGTGVSLNTSASRKMTTKEAHAPFSSQEKGEKRKRKRQTMAPSERAQPNAAESEKHRRKIRRARDPLESGDEQRTETVP